MTSFHCSQLLLWYFIFFLVVHSFFARVSPWCKCYLCLSMEKFYTHLCALVQDSSADVTALLFCGRGWAECLLPSAWDHRGGGLMYPFYLRCRADVFHYITMISITFLLDHNAACMTWIAYFCVPLRDKIKLRSVWMRHYIFSLMWVFNFLFNCSFCLFSQCLQSL